MRTILKIAILGCCLLLGSCIRESHDDCRNTLHIVYDYNMDRLDKFHIQVGFLSIFVFESESGLFVDELKFTGDPFDKDFEIDIPRSLYGKKCDYIVWAGLDAGSYDFPSPTKGVSTRDEFEVRVKGYGDQLVERQLEPLWHGMLADTEFNGKSWRTETISLTKDTNTFRFVFVFTENGDVIHPYAPDDLEAGIYTADGWMAHDNSLLDPADRNIRYAPYYSRQESDLGLIYEINTLRLMADRDAILIVRDKNSRFEVFRIPLIRFLDMLRLLHESWIDSLQEYLDREDNFRILHFMEKSVDGWISSEIRINGWVVREQGAGGDE